MLITVPDLSALIGVIVGAQLISHAGGPLALPFLQSMVSFCSTFPEASNPAISVEHAYHSARPPGNHGSAISTEHVYHSDQPSQKPLRLLCDLQTVHVVLSNVSALDGPPPPPPFSPFPPQHTHLQAGKSLMLQLLSPASRSSHNFWTEMYAIDTRRLLAAHPCIKFLHACWQGVVRRSDMTC